MVLMIPASNALMSITYLSRLKKFELIMIGKKSIHLNWARLVTTYYLPFSILLDP